MKNLFTFIFLLVFSKVEAQTSTFPIADSLFSIGKYAEAISRYQKIDRKTSSIYLKMAQAYRAQGNFEKALNNYIKGLKGKNALPAALSEYGQLLYRTQKFHQADSIFQELTTRFPENPNFQYQLGLAKEQLRDSTAIEFFQKAFTLNHSHQKAIYKLMVHFFQQKENEKVESLGKKALASYSRNAEIHSLLGQNALQTRNYSRAAKHFEKLISLRPNSKFAHEKLALSFFQLDKLEKAVEHYTIVIGLDAQNVSAHYYVGRIYNLLGKTKQAEIHLKKALLLKKMGLSGMYQALGNTYKLKKNFIKAIDLYQLALKENEYNMRAQFNLAMVSDNYYKDLETRLNYYKLFIKKFKTHPNAQPFLKVAKYRISQLKKEKFMKIDP